MNCDNEWDSKQLQVKLQAITADIRCLANSYKGNSLALLTLLRALEHSHREIRENFFQSSLPDSRHELYSLLKNIEEAGGWPYIERMKLRALMENLLEPEIYSDDIKSDN
jgi:hypothetical protein